MVRISEDMVRKRAEHNECEISTLEEVSLHQQDIEKIEHLDKWCRELKILYLQSNLIPKIENVGRMKKLEYLNLALNNVERIENLEECESLQKLDLTVNFIGELSSISCLKDLAHFRELYLTGNPCAEFDGYRKYVVATLPRLKHLDGTEIDKSERILALQEYECVTNKILAQQDKYRQTRKEQIESDRIRKEKKAIRKQKGPGYDGRWYTDIDTNGKCQDSSTNDTIDGDDKEFWDEKVPFTPESRLEVHEHMLEQRRRKECKDETSPKVPRRLMDDEGRALNINESKIPFSFVDDEENQCYILDLTYFKHMDTSLMEVDVQPKYVRVTAKGKVFQLRLDNEVMPDSSLAKRSQVTGHLLITMPRANCEVKPKAKLPVKKLSEADDEKMENRRKQERLEVDPSAVKTIDYGNIIRNSSNSKNISRPFGAREMSRRKVVKANAVDFVDDPEVPPLM